MARHDSQDQKQQKVNRQLAGGESDRDPDRLEMGGKRLHADATRGQQLGTDTDGDIDGDMERQSGR